MEKEMYTITLIDRTVWSSESVTFYCTFIVFSQPGGKVVIPWTQIKQVIVPSSRIVDILGV